MQKTFVLVSANGEMERQHSAHVRNSTSTIYRVSQYKLTLMLLVANLPIQNDAKNLCLRPC